MILHHLFMRYTQSNRLTIRKDNLNLHATQHAPSIVFHRGGLDKVYIKVDAGEKRKSLNIWLKQNVAFE